MSPYASLLDCFNDALVGLGVNAIQEGDTGLPARLYRQSMERLALASLRMHKFGFARKQTLLVRQGDDEREGQYIYALPADYILLHSIITNEGYRIQDYDVRSGKIVTRHKVELPQKLWLLHTYNAPASSWSPDFAEAVKVKVDALLYKALLEDQVSAREARRDAHSMFLEVIARDKYENPPEKWIVEPGLARHVHAAGRVHTRYRAGVSRG